MFGNQTVAIAIGKILYKADIETRNDLLNNLIANERDYISSFFTRVRIATSPYIASSFNYTAKVLDNTKGDGIIVFRYKNEVKVALLEGKVLTSSQINDYWEKKKNRPHFSSQILNQSNYQNSFAIFEMFIQNFPCGQNSPPLDKDGSSCLWFNDAYDYITNKKPQLKNSVWSRADVIAIPSNQMHNISDIVYEIIMCSQGSRLEIDHKKASVRAYSDTDKKYIDIPIPSFIPGIQNIFPRAEIFLSKNELSFYQYYNFKNLDFVNDFENEIF